VEDRAYGSVAGRRLEILGSPGGFSDQTSHSSVRRNHAERQDAENIHISVPKSNCKLRRQNRQSQAAKS